MKTKCTYLLLRLIAIIPISTLAQHPAANFKATHFGVEQGLSQGSNYFLLKDHIGFQWVSSYDGLNRFDGRHFKRYYPNLNDSTSIYGSEQMGMVEDGDGNIWIGTEQCLNLYNRKSDKFSSFFSQNVKGEHIDSQTHPFYADSTEVWYGNEPDGIVRLNFRTGEKQVVDSSLHYKIDYYFNFRVKSLGKGDFWMPQEKGIVHFNWKAKRKDWYFSEDPTNITGSPSEIFAYCVDGQVVWLGLKQGFVKLHIDSSTYQVVPSPFDFTKDNIYAIQVDNAGRVWLGTASAGVLMFDKSSGDFHSLAELIGQPRRYADIHVAALNYEPSDNILWVCTEADGLDKVMLDVGRIHSYHDDRSAPNDLNAPVVRCFTEDNQGRIWLGVWDGGINVFDPKNGKFLHHRHNPNDLATLPNKTVLGICKDNQGNIWAATEYGVGCFKTNAKGNGKWHRYFNQSDSSQMVNNNLCADICPLPDGTLAVGTNNGIFNLDPVSGIFSPIEKVNKQLSMVRNLVYDPQRDWLFATAHYDGFWVLKKTGKKWSKVISALKGISANCFHLVPNSDTVWIGTSQGLCCFNICNTQYQIYTVADGLPSNCVYGILEDDKGRLWLSTNRGISCFDPTISINCFENYGPTDGCQGFEYNINAFYRASWGELYFGGVNGFDRFFPADIQRSHRDFPVYLTDFQVNNQQFELDTVIGEASEISLRYFENNFSIQFTSLNWHSDDTPVYRFRLLPYISEWVVLSSGEDVARFVNVPPGKYRFEVEAKGSSGAFNKSATAIGITIVPAFWQTTWFKILVVVAILALLLGIIGFIIRTRYRLRLAAAQRVIDTERLRTRIAQDIHDEVGGSLTKISLGAQVAARLPDLSESELKARMEKLGADARHAAGQLREIVFAINPDFDHFEEMLAYFRETALEFWSGTSVTPHFDFHQQGANPSVPPDVKRQLLLIFKEALNNVAKHANAQNNWLSLQLDDQNRYLLEIRDDGRGFVFSEKNGFTQGLSGMKKRADSMGASFSVISSSENGTTIQVMGSL